MKRNRQKLVSETVMRSTRQRATKTKTLSDGPIVDLQNRLEKAGTHDYKLWIERYLRNCAKCRGVKSPIIRKCVKDWADDHQLVQQNGTYIADSTTKLGCMKIVELLFRSEWNEDKLAATYLIHDVLQPNDMFPVESLDTIEKLFSENLMDTWNVVDTLGLRLITTLINRDKEIVLSRMRAWCASENLWQARIAIVALVPFAKDIAYHEIICETASVVVKRPERFAKTCVGWILREVAHIDRPFVSRFIDDHLSYISVEALRNATKYFPANTARAYLQKRKEVNASSSSSLHSPD